MNKKELITYDELIENFLRLLDTTQGEEKENEKENKNELYLGNL